MKVPQHIIKSSILHARASEELQAEVEKELEEAQASAELTPDISELLKGDSDCDEDTEEL